MTGPDGVANVASISRYGSSRPRPSLVSATAIEVETCPADGAFGAVIRLIGEHDLTTQDAVVAALASGHGDVLVDLSRCECLSAGVLGVLVHRHLELARDGLSLELLAPDDRLQVHRILRICRADDVVTVSG